MKLNSLQTPLSWNDLKLQEKTRKKIDNFAIVIQDLPVWQMEGLDSVFTQTNSHSCLFYGNYNNGKKLSIALLGKEIKRSIHYVDLSLIVSKYIGETEKNITEIFEAAEKNNWILFFDEADALFGKRITIRDSHDNYANLETSYLLQRIEAHPGITIVSTNLKKKAVKQLEKHFDFVVKFKR